MDVRSRRSNFLSDSIRISARTTLGGNAQDALMVSGRSDLVDEEFLSVL